MEATFRGNQKMGKDSVRRKIRVSLENPISGIDSMVEILKCLKKLGSNAINIQSDFSNHQLTSLLEIQTEVIKNSFSMALSFFG